MQEFDVAYLDWEEGITTIREKNLLYYQVPFPPEWRADDIRKVVQRMIKEWGKEDVAVSRITDSDKAKPVNPETEEVLVYTLRSGGDSVAYIQWEKNPFSSPSIVVSGKTPDETALHLPGVVMALNHAMENKPEK
jgi:hypothetical protein